MMSHPLSPPRHLANLGLFSPSSSEEEISPAPKQPKDKKQPKETITDSNRCKYKTGKCLNIRTFKKNGSPHRLCLFHRQRANKIQRKFDRQKRQLTRTKSENVSELFRSSSMSLIPTFTPSTTPHDQSPLSAPPNMTGRNFAPNFIAQSFASKQQFAVSGTPLQPPRPLLKTRHSMGPVPSASLPQFRYSTGVNSRFSMESLDDASSSIMDDLWAVMPNVPSHQLSPGGPVTPQVTPSTPLCGENERLSVDEIDFLCSAFLPAV